MPLDCSISVRASVRLWFAASPRFSSASAWHAGRKLCFTPAHRRKGAGALAEPCRFPPPWTIEDLDACFVVTDSNREKLAYELVPRLAAMMLRKTRRQIARTLRSCGNFCGTREFCPVQVCGMVWTNLSLAFAQVLTAPQKTNPATFTINF